MLGISWDHAKQVVLSLHSPCVWHKTVGFSVSTLNRINFCVPDYACLPFFLKKKKRFGFIFELLKDVVSFPRNCGLIGKDLKVLGECWLMTFLIL